MTSLGIGLGSGRRALKRVHCFAVPDDAHHGRQRTEIAVEAARVEHLWHETAIGKRRRVTVTEHTGPGVAGEYGLDGLEAHFDPMAIPGVLLRVADTEFPRQILQHAQVVDRVDIACNGLRKRSDTRTLGCSAR